MGADRTVLDWEKVVTYFRALEKESPRVRVQELGKTTEGRPLIAAFIAAPDTVKNLDRYIEIQRKLADPRITPQAELESLITRGKSIGMSPGFTRFLGLAELAGGLGVALGVLTQLAALGLILIMLGAILTVHGMGDKFAG